MEPIVGSLDWADLAVLLGYFVVVFAVGIWVCDLLEKVQPKTSSLHAETEAVSEVTSWQEGRCIGFR